MAFATSGANAIFVVFCFPFLDLRYLTADGSFGIPRWHWPGSEDHKPIQFVGELGRVTRDIRDGRPGAINIQPAIRFYGQPAWHSIAGRQIFADNVGQVQAHIGFQTRSNGYTSTELLEQIGSAQVEIRRSSSGPVSLTQAGLALAERYLVNSALTSMPRGEPPFPNLVQEGAGSPFLVLVDDGLVDAPPEALDFAGHSRLRTDASSWTGQVGDQVLDIWMLPMHRRPLGTRLSVVHSLCRIVGWLQELAILHRVAAKPEGLVLDTSRLEAFVRERAGKLRRRAFEGWPVEPILARVTRQNAAMDAERASFVASVRPLLSPQTGNDILAILRRVDLHRDALELEAGSDSIFAPEAFVKKARIIANRLDQAPQRTEGEMPRVVERLEEEADQIEGLLLPSSEIRSVVAILVDAFLSDKRNALLAGLDGLSIADLETADMPKEQLLLDLTALNRIVPVGDVKPPLAEMLRNAAILMPTYKHEKGDYLLQLAETVEKIVAERKLA